MGEAEKYLDDSMEKNMEALEKAKQSGEMVEKIANRSSQIAQVSTSKGQEK